ITRARPLPAQRGAPTPPAVTHETEEGYMATMTDTAARTAHLLALMKKGEDAFNARDFAAVDTVHHADMIAYIPGNAQPIYGTIANTAAMQHTLKISLTCTCTPRTRPSSAAGIGSP